MKSVSILYIQDNQEDKLLFREVFEDLEIKNELKSFDNAKDVIDYL